MKRVNAMSAKNLKNYRTVVAASPSPQFLEKLKTLSAAILLYTLPALFFLILIQLTGCGNQGFVVGTDEAPQSAPGNFIIPPKVDLLLAQDNSASMNQAFNEISSQLPSFLNQLESRNWDYHFYATPLGKRQNNQFDIFNKFLVSKYDANWILFNQWKPPYPGADPNVFGMGIPAEYFGGSPSTYTGFLSANDIRADGKELGFESILYSLDQAPYVGFSRKDALTVVLVISTGDDMSGVNFCQRSDSLILPCSAGTTQYTTSGTAFCRVQNQNSSTLTQYNNTTCAPFDTRASSLSYYKSEFDDFIQKGYAAGLKMYSAVPFANEPNCRNYGTVKVGSRYQSMAGALGGTSFPLCNSSIGTILNSVAQQLETLRLDFQTRHLVINTEPNLSTVKITRIRNGVAQVIPQDGANGWSYLGYQENIPAIDHPTPMNHVTGYIFRLNGDSVLRGNDTANIEFKPAGASNSF